MRRAILLTALSILAALLAVACSAAAPSRSSATATTGLTASAPRTFYVSPTGSDSHAGTSQLAAWRTIGRVNRARLRAGDRVLFQGGATFAGPALAGNRGGVEGAPITYSTFGAGNANLPAGVYIERHSFLVFDHLTIRGRSIRSSDGIVGRGSNITIENSVIANVLEGIAAITGDRWHVLGNRIEGTGDSGILTQSGDEGGRPGDGWVIDGNIIANTGQVDLGYGEHGIYLKCRDSEVAHNTITNFKDNGISQRYGNVTIAGNTISGGGTGIAFFPYDSQPHTSRWTANVIGATETGLYAPASDSGSPPPGITLESFVISSNTIGPLTRGSHDWINVHTRGQAAMRANLLR